MTQIQRRGGGESALVFLLLGGIVGAVAELMMDLILFYTVHTSSTSVGYTLGVFESLVVGAVVGGAAFLGSARHYGLAAAAGIVALIAGFIGDESFRLVFSLLHRWPLSTGMFTSYFTRETAIWWALNLVPIATAAGLTALRVSKVARSSTAPPPAAWGPQPPFGAGYPGPWAGAAPFAPPPAPHGPAAPAGPAPWGQQPGPYSNPQEPIDPGGSGGPQPPYAPPR